MNLYTQCTVCTGPIPIDQLSPQSLIQPHHGALASFSGIVRNEHFGKPVTAIDYECHTALALNVFATISAQLRAEFDPGLAIFMQHGTGHMVPGDAAVVIHIGSGHRKAALAACAEAIEAIKRDLPVWKHEFYADGSSAWLEGS